MAVPGWSAGHSAPLHRRTHVEGGDWRDHLRRPPERNGEYNPSLKTWCRIKCSINFYDFNRSQGQKNGELN